MLIHIHTDPLMQHPAWEPEMSEAGGGPRHHSQNWRGRGLETAGSIDPRPLVHQSETTGAKTPHSPDYLIPFPFSHLFFLFGCFFPSSWSPFWLYLSKTPSTVFLVFKYIYFSFHRFKIKTKVLIITVSWTLQGEKTKSELVWPTARKQK